MEENFEKYRSLYLFEDVISRSVLNLIISINELNIDEENYSNHKPINLYINSYGGLSYDSIALIETIKNSKIPIYTHATGIAASSALSIFLSGHKRIMYKNSFLFYHDIAYGTDKESLDFHKNKIANSTKLRDSINKMILERTTLTKAQLNNVIKTKKEWLISAEDALKFKMADIIV